MSKKLLCLMVMLSFVGAAFAGQNFDDAGADHLFSNPDNWQMVVVPNDSVTDPSLVDPQWHTDAQMQSDNTICVIDAAHESYSFHPGTDGGVKNSAQILAGGSLTLGNWAMDIGHGGNSDDDDGGHGKLFMSGGLLDTPYINIPGSWTGGTIDPVQKGTLVMQDGVIEAGWINMATNIYDIGILKLDGGVINLSEWMELDSASASIEVGGGMLVIDGMDDTTDFQQYITDGWITAASGYTLSLDYDVTNLGATTLKAFSYLNPSPADDSQVDNTLAALTWDVPAPQMFGGVVTCDVYFGTSGQKVWSSLNIIDANIVTPENEYYAAGGADGDWVPTESGLPLLVSGNTTGTAAVAGIILDENYSWKVEVYDTTGDGIIGGPPVLVDTHIFEFGTFNQQPVVAAGNNLYSFLDGGSRTVTLDGTLEADDGRPVVAAPVWSVVSALSPFEDVPDGDEASVIPSASYSFVDPGLWNAQFQMSLEGDYVLQLIGDDTDLQSLPQTMIVFLRDTACDATVILPGYEALSGDFDENCIVDLNDFAFLASGWLSENAIDDTTEYIPPAE